MGIHKVFFMASCCLIVAGYTEPVCQPVCHNAAPCLLYGTGEPDCYCIPGTNGAACANYTGDDTSASPNNIALNKKVVHCQSGAQGIDLANNSIWSSDVCYNLTTDNVMIVDLEGIYNVKNVTFVAFDFLFLGYIAENVSVSVGWHLGDGCSVTDEVDCANYIGFFDGSIIGAPCNATTTGRYIRIQNNKEGEAIICIHQASGVPVDQYIQQAKFSKNLDAYGPAVSPFKDFPAVSKLSCARTCLQDPMCLNFRWTDGTCLLHGGLSGGSDSVTAYRYQGNV